MDLTLFFLRITYFVHSFVENQKRKMKTNGSGIGEVAEPKLK